MADVEVIHTVHTVNLDEELTIESDDIGDFMMLKVSPREWKFEHSFHVNFRVNGVKLVNKSTQPK